MELVRGLQNIANASRGCVLTVGNYDGVHLGHQHMIRTVKKRAGELKVPAAVLVFEPSSKEFFDPELLVEKLGARHVVVGDDFRYGSQACGSIESLRAAGRARGFGVEQMPPFAVDGVRVSSTAVRERLEFADY